jgi:hypothetical protein
MSPTLDALARDKEALLARSALCRLQLRRQTRGVRDSLDWRRTPVAIMAMPVARDIAFGLALSLIGRARGARMILLAGRILLCAKLAASFIVGARR